MVSLTKEQQMIVQSVRELAEDNFEEKSCSWQGETPEENVELLGSKGYLGIEFPEQYGGGGMSEFESILLIETVGRVCPDTAYAMTAHHVNASRTVDMFGSEAIKEKYLPQTIAGEAGIATAISEPEAGSDVQSMNTEIKDTEDGLILNGEKIWVTGIPDAEAAEVWVRFPEGLGSVLIDLDAPGLEIGQHFTNMAGYTQTQFFMNDIRIPEENVLTRGPEAFKQQLKSLNWERLYAASMANSMALCAFDKALEYAQDREQFGQPIGDFQGIEWKFAKMAKEIQLSRALTFEAAQQASDEGGHPDRLQTSIVKLFSAQMVERVASESLQMFGANGYQQGHPLEYLYRLARSRRIGGGTDEILKNNIASVIKSQGIPWLA